MLNKSWLFLLWWFIISLFFNYSLKAQDLYVGANYHPHDDKNIGKIKKDIQLMKAAVLNAMRMEHLAWDSYEPSEGYELLSLCF